jgi:hypothetical protein
VVVIMSEATVSDGLINYFQFVPGCAKVLSHLLSVPPLSVPPPYLLTFLPSTFLPSTFSPPYLFLPSLTFSYLFLPSLKAIELMFEPLALRQRAELIENTDLR